MVDANLAVGSIGVGLLLFLWGSDKTWLKDKPNWERGFGWLFLVVGVFYIAISLVVAIIT